MPVLVLLFLLCSGSLLAQPLAPLEKGETYRFRFHDVDGDILPLDDGRITITTVVTPAQEGKARAVAELVPPQLIGDPRLRYITVVNFQGKIMGAIRGVTRAIIRNRLSAEANVRRPDYAARRIPHDPRDDLHVVADFDGKVMKQLGLDAAAGEMRVFVFDGEGRLLQGWKGLPPRDELPALLERALRASA